jgi:Xaa-Pro dipeptidase
VHEAPYLVRGNATALQPGMCCSNEPMIVVPGRFGIRLEDHFHVTEAGAQWFTPPSPAIDRPFA